MNLLIVFVVAAQFCAPQAPRAPHDVMLKLLHDQWKESVIENGTLRTGDGAIIGVFEVTASEDGTWTAIATDSDGVACMMASGGDFSGALKPKVKGTSA